MPSGLMSSVHVPSLAEAIASPQASADALASALRSDATPLCLELLSQAAVALVQEAPDAVASLLNFFLAAARTCPLAIAAGLDSGELFNASTMHSFEKLPGALRTSAVKASLDLMCVVAEQGLPSSMLRSRSVHHLAQILVERAVDHALDIPSRSHAATRAVALIEATSPWSPPQDELTEHHKCTEDDDDDDDQRLREEAYMRCTELMLSALPRTLSASRPLATRLLHALTATISANPWRHSSFIDQRVRFGSDIAATGDPRAQQQRWSQLLGEHFDNILHAIEAPTQPIVGLLKSATYDFASFRVMLRRLEPFAKESRRDGMSGAAAGRAGGGSAPAPTGRAQDPSGTSRAGALVQVIRAQCLLDEHQGSPSAAATRLLDIIASNKITPGEADALLHAMFAPPSDPPRIIESIASAALRSPAALTLLARAATRLPDVVHRLMPLDVALHELEAALGASQTLRTSCRVASLVDLSTSALRCVCKDTEKHFAFMATHALPVVLAGAGSQWLSAVFAHPLDKARTTLPQLVNALWARVVSGQPHATVTLMDFLACASTRVAIAIHEHLRAEHRSRRAHLGAAASTVSETDEYDYMMEEAEAAAEEDELSETLLAQLRSDPIFSTVPAVLACAHSEQEVTSARVSATRALGRIMHAHEFFAQSLLKDLVTLSAHEQPEELRCASVLVGASLLVAFPAHAEQSAKEMLRLSLDALEAPSLRRVALNALIDLILSRRLQPTQELPHVLRVLTDDDDALFPAVMACIDQLSTTEGTARWSRLLHSSLLKLCATLPPVRFMKLLPSLVPSTLASARPQELEPLAVALVGHLVDAAQRNGHEERAHDGGDATSNEQLCRNLAHMIGAWPPADKSLVALQQALRRGGAGGVLGVCKGDDTVRRALQLHVQRARSKLSGTVLDEVSGMLSGAALRAAQACDGSDDDNGECDGHKPRLHRPPVRREIGSMPPDEVPAEEEAARASDAVAALRAKRPLYDSTRLPSLSNPKKHRNEA